MATDTFEVSSEQMAVVEVRGRYLGANNANMTKVTGVGVTSIVRTGEGAYTITFDKKYSALIDLSYGLHATTHADLKGYTVVFAEYVNTTGAITMIVYDSTFAAADLIAAQWISFCFSFRDTSLTT